MKKALLLLVSSIMILLSSCENETVDTRSNQQEANELNNKYQTSMMMNFFLLPIEVLQPLLFLMLKLLILLMKSHCQIQEHNLLILRIEKQQHLCRGFH
ncbi:hypothetical protein ACWGOQ_0013990 [Aquimarina sp. M1]